MTSPPFLQAPFPFSSPNPDSAPLCRPRKRKSLISYNGLGLRPAFLIVRPSWSGTISHPVGERRILHGLVPLFLLLLLSLLPQQPPLVPNFYSFLLRSTYIVDLQSLILFFPSFGSPFPTLILVGLSGTWRPSFRHSLLYPRYPHSTQVWYNRSKPIILCVKR